MVSAGSLPAEVDGGAGAEQLPPVLALDIGGTKLAAGVVDDSGHVYSFAAAPTQPEQGAEEGLARLWELGRQAVKESGIGWSEIDAVGICAGGPLDPEQGILIAPLHLQGWEDVPLTALAERTYGRPAVLENDATAAAAGEHRYGAGAGTRHMVYLTISTGVGGGVIVDGRLYRGAMGNGAELGHVTVDWKGRPCRGCGRRGCLEAYVSGTSIAERAREAGLDSRTAADVAAAARGGDTVARAVWEETVAALACGLTSLVNAFEPEVVVLGGGVSRSGEQLFEPVRERVRADAMTPAGRAARIVPAALGDHVGVVGAAAIVYERAASGGLASHG
jgi:glucokinase